MREATRLCEASQAEVLKWLLAVKDTEPQPQARTQAQPQPRLQTQSQLQPSSPTPGPFSSLSLSSGDEDSSDEDDDDADDINDDDGCRVGPQKQEPHTRRLSETFCPATMLGAHTVVYGRAGVCSGCGCDLSGLQSREVRGCGGRGDLREGEQESKDAGTAKQPLSINTQAQAQSSTQTQTQQLRPVPVELSEIVVGQARATEWHVAELYRQCEADISTPVLHILKTLQAAGKHCQSWPELFAAVCTVEQSRRRERW